MGNSTWLPMRLGDVCSKIGSGATPRGGAASYLDQGPYALVRSQNIYNHGFERDGLAFIDEDQAKALQSVELYEDDVLLNITGESVGRSCQVPKSILPARVNQHVAIVRADSTVLDPLYLRYALISPHTQQELAGLSAAGATRRALTKAMIESLVVRAPRSLETQRRIANTLGALDDKIELNRRMSETLEEIASTYFRSWLQEIRNGRETLVGTLADIVDFDPPEQLKRGVEAPYLGLAQIPNSGMIHEAPEVRPYSSGARFRDGDTLFARITPSLENGKTALALGFGDGALAWGSTELIVMRPKAPVPALVPYLISRDSAFRAHAVQNMSGTSGRQRVPREALMRYEFPVARRLELERLGQLMTPVVEAVWARAQESRTLAELRDTLLPKLISGELRVPEAEQLVSEVA